MIRYDLKCAKGHSFDSWFQGSDAFDKLAGAGLVLCPVCGTRQVGKAVMAPRVAQSARPAPQTDAPAPGALAEAASGISAQTAEKLAALRQHLEKNADYVGEGFAAQARDIHEGRAAPRAIYGEARADEARKLIEDGVPVAPLPIVPTRKVN